MRRCALLPRPSTLTYRSDCFDFEAAATHEVGHILGFSHPDEAGQPVYESSCAQISCGPPSRELAPLEGGAYDCMRPFESVREVAAGEITKPSVMHSLTQHNPTVCLTADDLDGLYRLYPDCALRPTEPVCFKASHNIGLVRLGVYVLIPIILALGLSTCLGAYTQLYQMARLKSFQAKMRRKASSLGRAQLDVERESKRAKIAERQLEEQRATEDARVDAQVESKIKSRLQKAIKERGGGDGRTAKRGTFATVVSALLHDRGPSCIASLSEAGGSSSVLLDDDRVSDLSFLPKTISKFVTGVVGQSKSFFCGGNRNRATNGGAAAVAGGGLVTSATPRELGSAERGSGLLPGTLELSSTISASASTISAISEEGSSEHICSANQRQESFTLEEVGATLEALPRRPLPPRLVQKRQVSFTTAECGADL